ncbi:MAG: hypothetical protein RI897_3550 [Verrucomicrobiota bacterium]
MEGFEDFVACERFGDAGGGADMEGLLVDGGAVFFGEADDGYALGFGDTAEDAEGGFAVHEAVTGPVEGVGGELEEDEVGFFGEGLAASGEARGNGDGVIAGVFEPGEDGLGFVRVPVDDEDFLLGGGGLGGWGGFGGGVGFWSGEEAEAGIVFAVEDDAEEFALEDLLLDWVEFGGEVGVTDVVAGFGEVSFGGMGDAVVFGFLFGGAPLGDTAELDIEGVAVFEGGEEELFFGLREVGEEEVDFEAEDEVDVLVVEGLEGGGVTGGFLDDLVDGGEGVVGRGGEEGCGGGELGGGLRYGWCGHGLGV